MSEVAMEIWETLVRQARTASAVAGSELRRRVLTPTTQHYSTISSLHFRDSKLPEKSIS